MYILCSITIIIYDFREGDISQLEVDAITNTSNETFTEKNPISNRIIGRAGIGLRNSIRHDIGGEYL